MFKVEDRLPYEGLIEHHLRIGDTFFFVPPTAISVHHQVKSERTPMMRSRSSLVKESGYFDKVININLFFADQDSINNELRPILAQLKKCPFLPVENIYLNDVHKVEAVTISGVTVQTVNGFPNCLTAQIQCYAFNPYVYVNDVELRTYDEMFDWELFRWYYKRNLNPQTGNMFQSYFEPLYSELDNEYMFRIADEDDLIALKDWKTTRRDMVKDYIDEQQETFWGSERLEKEFEENEEELYAKAVQSYDIFYEDMDMPGLVLTSFSASTDNIISSVQLQMHESPTHQYMGSQDTIFYAEFETTDMEVVGELSALMHRSAGLLRDYHKELSSGILEFDHQLTRLFGSKNVTIQDVKFEASNSHPGLFKVQVTMLGYNRMIKKLTEVNWMSQGAEWNINEYQNQTLLGLMTPDIPSLLDKEQMDNYLASRSFFPGEKMLRERPFAKNLEASIKGVFGGYGAEQSILDKVKYEHQVKTMFSAAEVYPDLELPTYAECYTAGFDVPNTNNGLFVDPDFFIKYQEGSLFFENILDIIKGNYEANVFRDNQGGEISIDLAGNFNPNEAASKQMGDAKEEFDKEFGAGTYDEVTSELIDKKNLTPAQAEALIRKKAQEQKLPQSLAVAFAKTMDKDLKQFYDKGTNANQGGIKNSLDSNPVMLNKKLEFQTSSKGIIDGEYIGIMKVRKMYGTNVNLMGKNIDYNIGQGVLQMKQFYDDLSRKVDKGNTRTNGKLYYQEENIMKTFNISRESGTWDEEKARFVGVVMMYMGYEKEYMALLTENKKPSSNVIQFVNKFLKNLTKKNEWSTQQIQEKSKDLPVKDIKKAKVQKPQSESANVGSKQNTDEELSKAMFHDMIYYDKRGRLVRAFPTFFMLFIDEGEYIGATKMSDQYFHYHPVHDIMYVNNRKDVSSTLYLELNNVYGSLDDSEKAVDTANTSYREMFKMFTMPGAVAKEAERSRNKHQNFYKSIFLNTGTRLHFRMGYGSNPMEMPTIMNGTITSLTNNEQSLSVVVQDDGYELANKLRVSATETTDGGFWFSKKEPTDIAEEILTDSQGFFKNMITSMSNKEYNYHSMGIMHFGSPGMPEGFSNFKSFIGGATGGAATGAAVGAGIGTFFGGIGAIPGAIAGAIGGAVTGGIAFSKEGDTNREILMNLYQTTGLTNEEHDKWWTKIKDAFGIGQSDEEGININLFDKTPWDVLNITASLGADHVVAVHPFGFRSTIFSGKPHFPLNYDYIYDDEKDDIKGLAMKPFKQFHIYDSYTSISSNAIKATEENIRTVAIGTYMNDGELDSIDPIHVDTNIWPEKQRVVNIDTTLNAKGLWMLDKIPLVGGALNKPFKWMFDQGTAIQIAASGLRDYMKDMYDGYLTVMGDPSVKPFDTMWIHDEYNSMSGPADVKEVTQIMNFDVGFITMIKPDLIAVNRDTKMFSIIGLLEQVAGAYVLHYISRIIAGMFGYKGTSPILHAFWALGKGSMDRMKKRWGKTKTTSKRFYDKVTKTYLPKNTVVGREAARILKIPKASMDRWIKRGKVTALGKHADTKINLSTLRKAMSEGNTRLFKTATMKKFTGTVVGKNLKSVGKAGKGLLKGARLAFTAVKLGTPVGWLLTALELLVFQVITAVVGEMFERSAIKRQAVMMMPLRKSGIEFTAGINGHQGSVVGDSPTTTAKILSSGVLGFLFGYDNSLYKAAEGGDFGAYATQNGQTVDRQTNINNFIKKNRVSPPATNFTMANYKEMTDAANKELKSKAARNEAHQKARAVYPDEEDAWEKAKESIGDWFGGLFDKIKDIFGSDKDDESGGCGTGDVSTSGKAIKLSKHFSVIGPKIEAEAKKQGLSEYAEIIKAKCMQESGGNYIRYPDVMQASESLGKPIGYIKNVDASITQGVKYFGTIIKKCNGDIKLALQSYNFGSGFISYANKYGGKYTKDLAMAFSKSMVQKMGRRISRIDPGYGDVNYVDNVLRYYSGTLPASSCESGGGFAESCPDTIGQKGATKYHISSLASAKKQLVDLKKEQGMAIRVTLVGGKSYSLVRKGTADALRVLSRQYQQKTGETIVITSGWRLGDPRWHGSGWAADIDTPNTMRKTNGKMRFPQGRDKDRARLLVQTAIDAGFREMYFGDYDICTEFNKKYGKGTVNYEPTQHHNHLHVSHTICK